MNNVEKSKNNFDMKEIHKLINSLIKEDRLKFSFYNSLDKLELLQLCYNKVDNTIEFEFRNRMVEYLEEMKNIMNKRNED